MFTKELKPKIKEMVEAVSEKDGSKQLKIYVHSIDIHIMHKF